MPARRELIFSENMGRRKNKFKKRWEGTSADVSVFYTAGCPIPGQGDCRAAATETPKPLRFGQKSDF